MGLGDLGSLGDIGGIIGAVLGISISAIVLLTFAPGIVGDIDNIALNGTERCVYGGEQFRWLAPSGSATTADDAWAAINTSGAATVSSAADCVKGGASGDTTLGLAAGDYFTPKGTKIVVAAAAAGQPVEEWKTANKSITALSGGSIAMILLSAAAILVPAGAIGFLGYFGARFVAENIGGGPLAIAIGATVIVVIAGAILPQIFEPLDKLYLALDGKRFWVYSQGIGQLN